MSTKNQKINIANKLFLKIKKIFNNENGELYDSKIMMDGISKSISSEKIEENNDLNMNN